MPDCIVIGAGVIGLLTARALHQAGMDVLVIERGQLGGESSWAGGGIISPLYPWRYADSVNRLAERSKQIYPALAAALSEDSGVDCELITSGMLYTDVDEYETARAWAQAWQVPLELIEDRQRLMQIEPALHPDIEHAMWMPDIKQIRNPKVVKALRGSLQHAGIAFIEHAEVSEILLTDNKVSGVQITQQTINAGRVIVASGAWSARVLGAHGRLDVEPVKGQMIMFRGEPDLVRTIVLSHGHYIIPRQDGHVLAGSTLERTGFEKRTSSDAQQALSADAASLVPLLGNLPIERHWAGLRPGTQNGIPYVCAHDEIEGLYIHAGHYRNGIVLGPASAQLMSEIVLGQATFCDASAYTMAALH